MSKKLVYLMFLVIILTGVLVASTNVHRVEAPSTTIYIRADGSVEPFTDLIFTADNITYYFTDNFNASIVVERSNIIIDGDEYTLTGPYTEIGFNLTDLTNVTITNVNVVGFGYGIYLQSSILNIISGNNITLNEGNIYLGYSSDNTITGNTITDGAEAIQLYASSNNTISGNNMSDNYNGVWLRSNSTENVISGNNITGNHGDGIKFEAFCHHNIIDRNEIIGNTGDGIEIYNCSNNTISGNNITINNDDGIELSYYSNNNTIFGNNVTANDEEGIWLFGVSNNTMYRNDVTKNIYNGIIFEGSSNYNKVYANNIENNGNGIVLRYSSNNSIYHNNIVNNTYPASTEASMSTWDNGFEGNYWSDYSGTDTNYDGVGEVPYEIDSDNNDMHPLMGTFYNFNTFLAKHVNVICNSTVYSFEYVDSTINLLVSNSSKDQKFGFVRICIPHTLMNETYHVTVNGTEPYYVNYNIADNWTHRWIYFEYEHSTLEIVITPEFPLLIFLPLFMTATLLATIVYRRKDSR